MRQINRLDTPHPLEALARWALVIYAVAIVSFSVAGIVLFPAYAKGHATKF